MFHPGSSDDPVSGMAQGMAQMSATFVPVKEAVVGYRAQLLAAGFSPEASEAMTVEYHRVLLGMLGAVMLKGVTG